MKAADPFLRVTWAAEQVIKDHQLTSLPIKPIALAEKCGIKVVAKPASSTGVSGMLIRAGQNYGIAYATHIKSLGFQNFSIAHELGHYFLPGHPDAVFANGDIHESRAGFASGDRYELEADHFAAALLMPKTLFSAEMRRAGDGLAAVECLAGRCETSFNATAIRMAQCSREPMAIVLSAGKSIDYCFMSDALKEVDGIDWIKKRQAVPSGTPTFGFNQSADRVRNAERADGTSDIQDWFGGSRSIEMQEDVIGLGEYGKTLTVLYGIELPDEDDPDDDEAIEKSWTPGFRRR